MSVKLATANLDALVFSGEVSAVEASPLPRNVPLPGSSSGPDLGTATPSQRRFALTASLAMALLTLASLPFARAPWGKTNAFLPIYLTASIGTCLITAYLMYGQYRAMRYRALLHLSAGYLFTAGILVMQLLSFPGLFAEHRRVLGGPQSTIWLWCFWHLGPR